MDCDASLTEQRISRAELLKWQMPSADHANYERGRKTTRQREPPLLRPYAAATDVIARPVGLVGRPLGLCDTYAHFPGQKIAGFICSRLKNCDQSLTSRNSCFQFVVLTRPYVAIARSSLKQRSVYTRKLKAARRTPSTSR